MNSTIVLDTEFETVDNEDRRIKGLHHEVLQIGAVKLDESYGLVDTFNVFIQSENEATSQRLELLKELSMYDGDFFSFEKAVRKFFDWCGDFSAVYTWSQQDLHILVDEVEAKCSKEDVAAYSQIFNCFQDLRVDYESVMQVQVAPSLEKALENLSIEYEGTLHNALDDAVNTARLLRELSQKKPLEKRGPIGYVNKLVSDSSYCHSKEDDRCSFADLISERSRAYKKRKRNKW